MKYTIIRLVAVVAFFAIMVGGCSYIAGECIQSGGEWDGDNLSCRR